MYRPGWKTDRKKTGRDASALGLSNGWLGLVVFGGRAEDLGHLFVIVCDVPLHDVHRGTHQPLERRHVQYFTQHSRISATVTV